MAVKLRLKRMGSKKKPFYRIVAADSNTIMSKTIIDEDLIDELFCENVSVIKVYDEFNKIHFRIAVQDKKSNQKFIKILKKVIKNRMEGKR